MPPDPNEDPKNRLRTDLNVATDRIKGLEKEVLELKHTVTVMLKTIKKAEAEYDIAFFPEGTYFGVTFE